MRKLALYVEVGNISETEREKMAMRYLSIGHLTFKKLFITQRVKCSKSEVTKVEESKGKMSKGKKINGQMSESRKKSTPRHIFKQNCTIFPGNKTNGLTLMQQHSIGVILWEP